MMNKNLMNPLRALSWFIAAAVLVMTTGCDNDDDDAPTPTMTTLQIIEGNADYSEFASFYKINSAILPDLSTSTEYTVFVPNNNAFEKLKTTLGVDDLASIKQDVIAAVLAFHFVSGTQTSIEAGASYTTSQGEDITVNGDGTIQTGGSDTAVEILSSEAATNGYVHATETILIPPVQIFSVIVLHLDKVSQSILLGADFSILADVITKADEYAEATEGVTKLTDLLSSDQATYTVFAPTNATFYSAAGVAEDDTDETIATKVQGFMDNFTAQEFYGIVANHVVVGTGSDVVTPEDLTTGATFATAFTLDGQTFGQLLVFNDTEAVPAQNGLGIYLDSDGDVDLQNPETLETGLNAEIAIANAVEEGNGVIHVIAGLLTP